MSSIWSTKTKGDRTHALWLLDIPFPARCPSCLGWGEHFSLNGGRANHPLECTPCLGSGLALIPTSELRS